jgi:glycosyltransferase involved in cell wall biosynthesis
MISFVIPALNEESVIQRCIWSIHKATFDFYAGYDGIDYEIIVVDNGSVDRTADVARQAGAIVVYEPTRGITRARQAGLVASGFAFVAFIDADNELPYKWIGSAIAAITQPGVVAASGPVVYRSLPIYKRAISAIFYFFARLIHQKYPMLQGGNFILRKRPMLDAGGFNTEIDFYGEDTDTAMRLSKIGEVVFSSRMWAYTSSRRMDEEGLLRVGLRYIVNYAWVWIAGRPWTTKHCDHR